MEVGCGGPPRSALRSGRCRRCGRGPAAVAMAPPAHCYEGFVEVRGLRGQVEVRSGGRRSIPPPPTPKGAQCALLTPPRPAELQEALGRAAGRRAVLLWGAPRAAGVGMGG